MNNHNERAAPGAPEQTFASSGAGNTAQDDATRRRLVLRALLDRHRLNVPELARLAGMRRPNRLYNFLNGHSLSLSQATLEQILAAFPDGSADELLDANRRTHGQSQDAGPVEAGFRLVSVSVIAQAGCWRKGLYLPLDEQQVIPIPDALVPARPLLGVRVAAPGAELLYPSGALIICSTAPDDIHAVSPGRRVVVARQRGRLVEVTVREAVVHGGETWLWPRSTSPEYQEPLIAAIKADGAANGCKGATIIGIALASWQLEKPVV